MAKGMELKPSLHSAGWLLARLNRALPAIVCQRSIAFEYALHLIGYHLRELV